MSLIGDLLIRIGADQIVFNQFHDQLSQTRSELQQFAVAASELGEVIQIAISEPISQLGETLLGFREDVQAAQNTLIGMTGAVGDSLTTLSASMSNVFAEVPQSIGDVATVLGTLTAKLGLAGEPLEALGTQLLDLARITGESVAPLVETSAKLFQQWSVATDDQSASLDHLLQVAQAAGAKVGDIEGLMSQFGASLQEVGLGFNQAADLIGTLTKAGLNAAPVLQGIQKSLLTMSKAGLADPIEGLQLIITKIQEAGTEGQAFAIGAAAFGKGATQMVQAIRSGKLDLDAFTGSLATTDQTIEDTAERMLTLGEKWKEVKNQLEVALAPVGEAIERVFESALEALQPVIDEVVSLAHSFEELSQPVQNAIIGIGLFGAALGPVLGAFAIFSTGVDLVNRAMKSLEELNGAAQGLNAVKEAEEGAAVATAAHGEAAAGAAVGVEALGAAEATQAEETAAAGFQLNLFQGEMNAAAAESAAAGTQLGLFGEEVGGIAVGAEDATAAVAVADAGFTSLYGVLGTVGIVLAGAAAGFELLKLDGVTDQVVALTEALAGNWSTLLQSLPSWDDLKAAISSTTQYLGPIATGLQKIADVASNMKLSDWIDLAQPQLVLLKDTLAGLTSLITYLGGKTPEQAAATSAAARGAADAAKALAGAEEEVGSSYEAADKSQKKFSDNALAAFAKLTVGMQAYTLATQQLKLLQEQLGAKSLPILNLQIADLQQRINAPTATDADNQMLAYDNEIIKLNRDSNRQTSDDTLAAQADLASKLKIAGMDRAQAFSLLGLTSTQDLDNQVQQIVAAQNVIDQGAQTTADDRIRVAIATSDKELAIWRQEGASISDDFFQVLDNIKTQWASLHLDLGQAFGDLGLQSVGQITNALQLQQAALAKIQQAVAGGAASWQDADNAEIASLQKKQSALASIGQAITDDEVARLKSLTEQRQAAALTTDQSLELLGLPSETDLNTQLSLLDSAYAKIQKDQGISQDQMTQATAAYLAKYVAAFKAAGVDIGDDFIAKANAAAAAARDAALTITQAFSTLGVLSTANATLQLAGLQAAFDKVANSATSTAADIDNALIAKLQGDIATLTKSGQAVSDTLVTQLDNLAAKVKANVLTIDQAYSSLGVEGLNQFNTNLTLAQAALDKINADITASDFQRYQAQVNYNDLYYQNVLKLGGQIDEYDKAQNDLQKQRIQQFLSDQQNIYTQFAATIKQIYGTIQGDLTDVITGAKTLGQAFQDIGQQIEKALVDYVVKNLLLTQSTLNSITDSLLSLLHDLVGGFGGTSSIPSGVAGIPGIGGGASSDDPGAAGGAGAASATGGGIISALGGVASALGLIVNGISDIVQGFQLAHLISTDGKIEQNTRGTNIGINASDGVAASTRSSAQNLQSIQNWLWDPFYTVLVGMSSDLDDIRGAVLNGAALAAQNGNSSSSPVASSNQAAQSADAEKVGVAVKAMAQSADNLANTAAPLAVSVDNLASAISDASAPTVDTSAVTSQTYQSLGLVSAPVTTATTGQTNFQFSPGTVASGKIYTYNGQPLPFTTDAEYNAWLQQIDPTFFNSGPSGATATTGLVNFQFSPDQVASGKIYTYNGQPLPFTTDAEYNAWLQQIDPAFFSGPSGATATTYNPYDYFSRPAPTPSANQTNPFAGLTFNVGSSTPNPTNGSAPATPTPVASGLPSVQPSPTVNLSVTVTGNTFASQDQFTSAIDQAVQNLRNNAGLTN